MKKLLFSCVIGFFCVVLWGQSSVFSDYVIRQWNAADGLPVNSATDIIQTRDGYIYVGSYEGLIKFDGFDFSVQTRSLNPLYTFLSARSVFEDSKGNLWVGSNDDGVQRIGSDGSISYTVHNGLPNNSIRAIAEDKLNNIWIGTAAGLVYITPDGQVVTPGGLDSIEIDYLLVTDLYSDTSGVIWVLMEGSTAAYYYSDNTFKRFNQLDGFGKSMVTAISQDNSGAFWFGLDNSGMARLSGGKVEKIHSGTLIDNVRTNSIYADPSGAIWFGTEKGLALYRDGKFYDFHDYSTIGENSINKIMGDREGNIWLATANVGIQKLSLGKFRTVNMGKTVNAVLADASGNYWIGSDSGLYCYDGSDFVENELTEYCRNLRIRYVYQAKNGDILVNCYTAPAFVRYGRDGVSNLSQDDGLAGNKTRVSLETSDGDIYIGTTTGLSVLKPDGAIVNYHRADGITNEFIMELYEDSDGYVWVGTDGGGIFIMKDGRVVDSINTEDGLSGNVIFKIIQDSKGIFWISTGSGLCRLSKTPGILFKDDASASFCNFSTAEGLGTDSVFQMLIDYTNTAWMVTNRGICSVPVQDMNLVASGEKLRVDSKFYNQNDGLITVGPSSTALSTADKFGRMWFTLIDGFAIYDPVKTSANSVLPIVHIEWVKVDDVLYEKFNEEIQVPPRTKRVEIKYTGLSFNSPERTRFEYMMTGFDDDFSPLTSSKIATYTNLKPGKYRFIVDAMNGDGNYSEAPVSVNLRQIPLFYQRRLFWIVSAAALLVLVSSVFIIRDRENKKIQLRLETMVQMKTVDLEIEKDNSDRLLRNILPDSIANTLKEHTDGSYGTIAERCDSVTVLFSDIVGFTNITSHVSAEDLVSALNDLIGRFDVRAKAMGVEKIKTVGDAYMAACGVPEPDPHHAEKILDFARGMYQDLDEYNRSSKIKFQIRIGINSGSVIAGVIGKNKFIYDIWGDTVNVASRMESVCTPGRIRMTDAVHQLLMEHDFPAVYEENDCEIKGKGMMKTFEVGR